METLNIVQPFLRRYTARSHPEFLVAAYDYIFGRGLDEAGYNTALAQLYAGRSREDLLREWLQSAEFTRSGRSLTSVSEPVEPPTQPPPRDQLEQYQDIWIRGRCVSRGRRECAERFELIAAFCRQYQRPFTVLDLGANLAYFSVRLAETFPGCTAVACEGIYGDWTREILEENGNPRVILLHHTFRLADLRALADVEHFDVVLALSVVHHLDGPFAESLPVLRSLGDHLILELPTEADACGAHIVEEIRHATLPADAHLLGHGRSHLGGEPRPIYRLSQPKNRLTKSYLGTPRLGLQLTIDSDFQHKRARFHNKPEHRDWWPGINLQTYLWFHGSYPRAGWIADELEHAHQHSVRHRDIQPWNVILGGGTARLIDFDDPRHAFNYHDEQYHNRLIHLLRLADAAQLRPPHLRAAPRAPVRWCGPVFNPSGYANEAINFLIPLARRLTLGLEHHNNLYSPAFVAGLPAEERRTLLALQQRFSYLVGGILIAHNPAPGFRQLPDAVYRIGRTMFETDRLPPDWVTACNRMDEIWVPSQFNVETFTRAGVLPDLLHVIPEAVDHTVFDPARHEPLPLPNRARFNFLAIFEWSSRKAWDVLLAAYLREFSAEDDVCLYLRTYLFGEPDSNPRDTLWQLIREYAATLNLGNKPWPRIELLTEQVSAADLPRLYRAADCLVAPTRGEGWGRPQHEAMLMELPVITTRWSALTEFIRDDVAYPLDYELVDIRVVEPELWHYRGHRWANPSETHLRQLMRHVQQHPEEARARGRAAREHMAQHYNRETVADLVVKRLLEIERRLTSAVCAPTHARPSSSPTTTGSHDTAPTIRIAWQGASGNAGSLAHVNRELTSRLARQPGIHLKTDRPDLTVRHQWPPDWSPASRGALVVMQPWEYGHIPADWLAPLERVTAVWTPSEYARRCFVSSGVPPDKVRVVPNGIDPQRFRPDTTPRVLPTKKSFKFLFVGGTIFRKGIDLLLRAWRETFTAADDVCLVIKDFGGTQFYAGQTAENDIRATAAAGGAEILYLNEDWSADELPGLYTACDCLVHPYRGEGFGLPVLEAMACGLPVIVTGGGATDDFATDEFAYRLPARRRLLGGRLGSLVLAGPGWLLEPDVEALCAALRRVVDNRDEARARGRAAAEYVRQHWTWDRAARVAAELARELVQAQQARMRPAARSVRIEVSAEAMQQPPPLPARPRLTVCVLTRNEEANLPRCLDSVRGVADQIVVLDTGSTDRTRELARERGAEVHEFVWCDDFSAARNAALAHATGDWVLMLDADEELTAESRAVLTEELRAAQVILYRLPLVDAGREADGVHYVPRLFRNLPGIRYVGRVHEQLWPAVEPLRRRWKLETRLSRIVLRHYGYDEATRRARRKSHRNLLLLQRALDEQPDDPNLWMNLGLELGRVGQGRASLEAYRRAWEEVGKLPPSDVVPEFRETLLVQTATALFAHQQHEQLETLLQSRLARAAPLSASLLYLRGLARWQRQQFEAAASDFEQCIARRKDPPVGPVHRDVHGAAPHHALALCRQRLGQMEAAAAAFEEAIARDPQAATLRRDYAEFLVARGLPLEALRQLHAALEHGGDDLATWRRGADVALEHPALWEFACDWTAEAYRHHPADGVIRQQRATALLAVGQLEAAVAIWKQTLGEEDSSREFLLAYRRLLQSGASGAVAMLHRDVDRLAALLPTAARWLRQALAEAAA